MPAKAAFGSASVLLAMIRVCFHLPPPSATSYHWLTFIQDSMANQQDYVEFGLSCADVCKALDRGLNGKKLDELSQFVLGAIGQLST